MLEIELLSYNNPNSTRSNGQCCDGMMRDNTGSCKDKCDNDFIFCLRGSSDSVCTYGSYETGLVAMDDTLIFGNTIGENTVPNPLIFNGTEWPSVNVRLCCIVLYSLCVI